MDELDQRYRDKLVELYGDDTDMVVDMVQRYSTISPNKRQRNVDFGESLNYITDVYSSFTSTVGNVMGYWDQLTDANQMKVIQAFNRYMFQADTGPGGLSRETIRDIHELYKVAKTEYERQKSDAEAGERTIDPNYAASILMEGLSYYLGQAQPNQLPPEVQGSSSVDDDEFRRKLH